MLQAVAESAASALIASSLAVWHGDFSILLKDG